MASLAARFALLSAPQLDYDEGVYWESVRSMAAGHALFREVFSSQPPGFLLLVQPGFLLAGHSLWGARAAVAALSMALVFGAWLTLHRSSRPAAIVAAVAGGFDPLLLRGSVTLQADVPAIALAMLALGLLTEATAETGRRAQLMAGAAGFVAVAAVMVKFLAIPVAAALLILLIGRRALPRLLPCAVGGVAAVAAFLAPVAGDLPAVWEQSVALHLDARSVVAGGLGYAWVVPPAAELLLAVPAALGVAVAWRAGRSPIYLAGAAWLAVAIVALAYQRPIYPHHVVGVSAPAVLLAGFGVASLGARLGRASTPLLVAAAGLGLAAAVYWLPRPPVTQPADLASRLPTGDLIVTDDQFLAAAAGLDTPPWLVDTSQLRVESGELTSSRVEQEIERGHVRAVLFGSGRLAGMPGFQEWVAASFPERQTLAGGEELYLRSPAAVGGAASRSTIGELG